MSSEHDRLRSSLHDLADVAQPADMYERAMHRSRRIARREAAIGTGAAVVVLAVLTSGLWRLPHGNHTDAPLAVGSHSTVSATPSWSATSATRNAAPTDSPEEQAAQVRPPQDEAQPRKTSRTAKPRSRTLADLPGHVFYRERDADPDVVRLSPGRGTSEVVLPDAPSSVGISPDGARIAYVTDGKLLVSDSDGTEQVAANVITADQAPVWSPEGNRLLVMVDAPSVLDLTSGSLTPLPDGLTTGQHFRWSGDGSKLVYATTHCGLEVAASDDETGTTVPVLGDTQPQDNPDGLAACKPTSVDATGLRVTVPLQTTGESTTGTDTADAVIDTATGKPQVLPVEGTVVGAVFDPEGNLLVRTKDDDGTTLSLFAPDRTLRVQASEPASVRDLDLLAYTR